MTIGGYSSFVLKLLLPVSSALILRYDDRRLQFFRS